jgi:hypothetical protein
VIRLKLMPDYECFPLWWVEHPQGLVGDVDPETLPLEPATRARLLAWAKEFDESLDWDDPGSTKPAPQEELDAFAREGLALLKQLRKELAGKYEVVYYRPES